MNGEVVNQITVDPEVSRYARIALERMLAAAPKPLTGSPTNAGNPAHNAGNPAHAGGAR